VRKEQLRKEREAQEVLNMTENRCRQNKRKAGRDRGSRSSGARGSFMVASVSNNISLPQLSPMLLKSDSFSDVTRESPNKSERSSGNEMWMIEVDDSPKANSVPLNGSVTPDGVPVAFIAFPRKNHYTNMTHVSFSPLRSRNNM